MQWHDRITSNPDIAHGKMCIKGTRIPVSVVLDNLAVGTTPEALIKEYPTLALNDVRAAIAYAAELSRDPVLAFLPGAA